MLEAPAIRTVSCLGYHTKTRKHSGTEELGPSLRSQNLPPMVKDRVRDRNRVRIRVRVRTMEKKTKNRVKGMEEERILAGPA